MYQYNYTIDSNELYHYGVLGMKWGVRAGVYTRNRVGGVYTARQKKKMTSQAVKLLTKQAKKYYYNSENAMLNAQRFYSKEEKYRAKSDKYKSVGKTEKSKKANFKADGFHNSAASNQAASFVQKQLSRRRTKTIDDIESGKIKAGKDFVTNTEWSSNVVLDAAGLINLRRTRTFDMKHK